ncbi:MAG TPA: efflux RND transporter permease subunit [Xanthomonadales bacterium]|nr:efflux RND transporter permease subunit [Xanthomonadales bacterium]
MTRFNLSEWALRNRPVVLYFMLVLAVLGVWSYFRLGQSEDPPFTFKAMVIRTMWPGATAQEVSEQITERIETKLLETGSYEYIRSYSRPGESQVFFVSKDALPSRDIPDIWYQVRKKVSDIRHTLPPDIVGPFYNDEFGDTFGNIYALTGEGFQYSEMKDYAQRVQLELLRVKHVGKVDLIGLQDEKIFIELSNAKIATLGVAFNEVLAALAAQNAVVPSGAFETSTDRVFVRASGPFESVESIREMPIRAGDRLFRLGDVAEVKRGYADPAQPRMRFMGQDAIGLAVSMAKGGDIIELGEALEAETARITNNLPHGMELAHVADQPKAVRRSIAEFVRSLAEAVVIVLIVSFLSLGFRTGLVVALSIPLVLAMTFATMLYFGIDLHKISLGALIVALGLLVDDAIIAVEMMAVKLEEGLDRVKAAAFAYQSTAFPMLTGTLVTAAGFLPIATAASGTGEYTRSIFQVVVIALLISWVAAVVFIPYLGYRLLPDGHGAKANDAGGHHDPHQTPFYAKLRRLIEWCLDRRKTVLVVTLALLVVSLAAFKLVPQQFFPNSTRLELMVDLKLPEGASLEATEAQAKKLEEILAKDEDIENYVAYVGTGSPRFYLPLDQQLAQASFAQFVVMTRDLEGRERVRARLIELFETDFHALRGRVARLENGPPVGFPIQYRVSGEDIPTVRENARKVADVLRAHGALANVQLDWEEPSKIIRLDIDQERARVLGVSSQDLKDFLQSSISGSRVSVFREGDELIEMVLRGPAEERERLSLLQDLAVPTASGRSVPLAQIATVGYGFENGIIWRRNRLPTVTVRADIRNKLTAPTVVAQISPTLDEIRNGLPAGFLLETGGTVEDSARGQNSINAGMPLFLLVVVTLLMLQLRSFSRTALVLLTAPLGLIGVTLFLLVFRVPFGFVAMLGTIALAGMIMRNSVILVDQIEHDIVAGNDRWHAIIEATVRRFRPIVLTALAAVLAMIPLSRSAFFGPMAVAIMGGLIVATALTLLFLPALYAAWFRVQPAVRA